MERAKRYFINALILSGCTLLMRTVGVAFNAFCVDRVGAEGMGLFSLVMSVYTFAVTFATSGVNLAATRLVALHVGRGEGNSAKSAMRSCLLYAAAFGTAATVGLFFFAEPCAAHFLHEPRAAMSLRGVSLSLLPLSLCSAVCGYFAAVRRVYKNAMSQVIEQAVKIAACAFLLALLAPRGVEYACLALVLGGALSETASFFLQIFSYVRDKRALTGGGMPVPFREVARISLPVALSAYVRSGLVTVEHVLIPVGLTAFGDANALATYGVISAVALPVVLYPTAFVGAFSSLIIPEVTEFDAKENRREVAYVTSRAFSVTLFCAVPAAGFFGAFAADICRVVYGDTAAADYLRMLAPLMPVMFLDTVTDSILKGLGKQFYTMCVNIADAAVSVLLVAVLVPKMGIVGYIVVIYVSECVNTLFSIGKLCACVDFRARPYKWLLAPLAAAAGAARIAVLVLSRLGLAASWGELCLAFVLFALCYGAFCALLGALGREELCWLKNIFRKERKPSFKTGSTML